MPPTVYVETTVLSYLAARPSRDLVVAAHQRLTAEWWPAAPTQFTLVASAVVTQEAAAGNPQVAGTRLALLAGLPLLEVTPEALTLAAGLLRAGHLPPKADFDALLSPSPPWAGRTTWRRGTCAILPGRSCAAAWSGRSGRGVRSAHALQA